LAFTDERVQILGERIVEANELTAESIESGFNSRREQLRGDREAAGLTIKSEIDTLRASIETSYIEGLKVEREMYQKDLAQLQTERQSHLARENQKFQDRELTLNKDIEARRRQLVSQLNDAEKVVRATEQTAREEIESAGFFSVSEVTAKQESKIAEAKQRRDGINSKLDAMDASAEREQTYARQRKTVSDMESSYRTRMDEVRSVISQKSLEISTAIATKEADIKEILENRMRDMRDVEEKFGKQLAENSGERARKFELLHSNEETVAVLQLELEKDRSERAVLRDNINQRVGNNQVYRIAQQWHGEESAADLSRDQVGLVALLWFGSLAALSAFTGVVLALASYVIRDEERFARERASMGQGRSFFNSLRRTLVFVYKRAKSPVIKYVDREVPKEVVREVPVEKVVKVETPVQVIRNRIVHVPLYTNDPDLLNLKTEQQLEEEINEVDLGMASDER
jgi:hypothetical protein